MAETRRILIVANPTSGRGRGRRTADAVASCLRRRGVEPAVHYTSGAGDAEGKSREAVLDEDTRPACIVACGGDGTVQEVANAIASMRPSIGEACPVMGLAPAGRCNDFARALDIPDDPAGIADALVCGEARAIDLGRVNDRFFCTVATVGVDAAVSSYVDSMRVPLTGTLAYLYGAMRVLSRYRPRRLRISGDFGVIDRPLFLASSANTSSYGGAIKIAPDARPTDGRLDLCVIDAVSRLRALTLVPTVLAGRHQGHPEVQFARVRQVHIESDETLELWADGERIGSTPADISVAPGAIRVMLPKGGVDLATATARESVSA